MAIVVGVSEMAYSDAPDGYFDAYEWMGLDCFQYATTDWYTLKYTGEAYTLAATIWESTLEHGHWFTFYAADAFTGDEFEGYPSGVVGSIDLRDYYNNLAWTITGLEGLGLTVADILADPSRVFAGDDVFTGADLRFGDQFNGGDGYDVMYGLGGDDDLFLGRGGGIVEGGDGLDRAGADLTDQGADVVYTHSDTEASITVGGTATVVFRGVERIEIYAGSGYDRITGGGGDDIIGLGTGGGVADGGAGLDRILLDFSDRSRSVTYVHADGEAFALDGSSKLATVRNAELIAIEGGSAADVFKGGGLNDFLSGAAGNDTLEGNGGDDTLVGGSGDDTLRGGGGDDLLYAGAGRGLVDGGEGVDRLFADLSSEVGAITFDGAGATITIDGVALYGMVGVERFQVQGGAGADRLIGAALADVLGGGDGDDVLYGLDGDDELHGGAGVDQLIGGGGDDVLWLSSGVGAVDGGDGSDVAVLELSGFSEDLFYTHSDSLAEGGVSGLVLFTLEGVERLTFRAGSGADSITGGAFGDEIIGGDGIDNLNGGGGDDVLVDGRTHDLEPQFGDFDDTLSGGAGDDQLIAFGGADILDGGEGNDILRSHDARDDILRGGAGWGYDQFYVEVTGNTVVEGGDAEDDLTLMGNGGWNFDWANVGKSGFASITGVEWFHFVAGTNRYSGRAAVDQVSGGIGNDTFILKGGDDTGAGMRGDDVIDGGDGNDLLDGGDGADRLIGGAGHDRLYSGEGDDFVEGGDGNDSILEDNWIYGGVDQLFGGAGNDVISAGSFNDLVDGGAGNDNLEGATGDDLLIGGEGDDILSGSGGIDTVSYQGAAAGVSIDLGRLYAQNTRGAGLDEFREVENAIGSAYADVIIGGAGTTRLEGGDGDDVLGPRNFGATLDGGAGFDWVDYSGVVGGSSVDLSLGRWTFDVIVVSMEGWRGGDQSDAFTGGNSDDVFDGGGGSDRLSGGLGLDFISFESAQVATTLKLAVTDDWQETGDGSVFQNGFEGIRGSAFADSYWGDAGSNRLLGFAGDDTLRGEGGADRLAGGSGQDTVVGGAGDDVILFAKGDGRDVVLDFVAGGVDDRIEVTGYVTYTTVQQGADLLIVLDAENSILLRNVTATSFTAADINIPMFAPVITGTASGETLTGTAAAETIDALGGSDSLIGNAGDDVLNGGEGNDRLVGGAGDDALNGGDGTDQADYRNATAAVTVNLLAGTATGEGSDTLSSIENVQGSAFGDNITGDDQANNLNGHAGNDALNGDAGNDTLIGGAGADQLNGGLGLDYASYISATAGVSVNLLTGVNTGDATGDVFTNIERFRLSAFADSFQGGAGTNYAYGAEGNDQLRGGAGFDRLYGEADNDQLFGEGDNDVLIGGAGADAIDGGAGKDGASYETASAAVSLNLTTGTHTGDAAGDTFTGIEFFMLSRFDDSFTGGAAADEAQGGAGADTLSGAGGADWLRGQDGNDILNGEIGDDILEGGAGADQLNGGDGIDYASYLRAVGINRATGVHTGEAAGDTFNSVERFRLSGYDDSFTGSAGDDWVAAYMGNDSLSGGDGNDTLNGGGSSDTLVGGAGNDKLIGEAGNDTLTGGAGSDAFQFTAGLFGADVITDFGTGDYIRVTGIAGVDDISDLAISQTGANTLITFPDGSTITLNNTSAATIDAGDFSFG